jgi:hypothetical protein
MSHASYEPMSDEEKAEYIDNTLAALRQFLVEASPNKHAVLLMLDEDDHLLQTFNFNTTPSLAVMMLGSTMEMIREELNGAAAERLLN